MAHSINDCDLCDGQRELLCVDCRGTGYVKSIMCVHCSGGYVPCRCQRGRMSAAEVARAEDLDNRRRDKALR